MNDDQIKNLVRGLIGTIRGKMAIPNYMAAPNYQDHTKYYQLRLKKILAHAKSKTPATAYEDTYRWIKSQIHTQIPELIRNAPDGEYLLHGISTSQGISLSDELAWATIRIKEDFERINLFCEKVTSLEDDVFNNRAAAALEGIETIIDIYGFSYWAIDAQIAIKQKFLGLEQQKQFTESVKRHGPKTLLAFYAHQVSTRNEPSITLPNFSSNINKRLQRSHLDETIKTYLSEHLTGSYPKKEKSWLDMMNCASVQGIPDLYENFILVAQSIILHSRDKELKSKLLHCLRQLEHLRDYRIQKMRLNLGDTVDPGEINATKLYHAIGEASPYVAIKSALMSPVHDISANICGALILTTSKSKKYSSNNRTLIGRNIRQIAHTISKQKDYYRTGHELQKKYKNLNFLPTGRGFLATSGDEQTIKATEISPELITLISLNNRFYGIEDAWVQENHALPGLAHKDAIEKIRKFFSDEPSENAPPFVKDYFSLAAGDITKNINLPSRLEHLFSSSSSSVQTISKLKAIKVYATENKISQAIKLTVSILLDRPDLAYAIDFKKLFLDLQWEDVSDMSDDISLPVFLHMVWQQTAHEEIETLLRFSFDEFLDSKSITRPSQIEETQNLYDTKLLCYFLRNVCIKPVMDMNLNFKSSKEVEDERISVCSTLLRLDPENTEYYQEEIFIINYSHMIQDGIRLVDSSRIHADIDPIKNILAREIQEDFRRYKDLVEAGIGVSENFDEVLKNFSRHGNSDTQAIMVPENEADDLLVRMVDIIRDRFLFEPSHGLDSYLSKRIRHGSVQHHMRRPAETEGIITQRSSTDNKYEGNSVWIDRLSTLPNENREDARKIFSEFSKRFDKIVLNLKDNLFHVKTTDNPRGMIDIELKKGAHELIRAAIKDDDDVNGLINATVAIIWGYIQVSLVAIRELLRNVTKKEIAETFDGLRTSLSKVAANDPNFPALITSIGRASSQSQAQTDIVASWFVESKANKAKEIYSLQNAMAICIESSLRNFGNFRPHVEYSAPEDISIKADDLVKLYEVIWVMFQNVHQHSGLESPPHIDLSATHDIGAETLSITCTNTISPSIITEESTTKLNDLRHSLSDGSYTQKLRKEGRSGFSKVASLVKQSEKGDLQFGFEQHDKFFVRATMAFIMDQSHNMTPNEDKNYAPAIG